MKGYSQRVNRGGFTVASVHYTADPEKDTPEWLAKAKEGMSRSAWQREYEINYEELSGTPVYGDFDESKHVLGAGYEKSRPLIRGWDFGYRHPACVFAQIDSFDRLVVLDAIVGSDIPLHLWATRVLAHTRKKFPGCEKCEDYCDPAGSQKNDRGERSSVQILGDMGIYAAYSRSSIMRGIMLIQQLLLPRRDDKYGLVVSRECDDIIRSGFRGGYKFKEAREGFAPKEEPNKDGYYDHIFDALRYVVIMKFNFLTKTKEEISAEDAEWEKNLLATYDPLVGVR